jgi:hypothetical protein
MDTITETNNNDILSSVVKMNKVKKPVKLDIVENYEDEIITEEKTNVIINKGTGAGGANTNYYGKKFEEKTDNTPRLLKNGYKKVVVNKKSKNGYYLYKNFDNKKVVFVSQSGLKDYIKYKYNIEIFRCPDEAYILEYTNGKNKILILEKKEQNVDGSVDTKLLAGPTFKEEYEEALEHNFEVEYAFCVSKFLQTKIMSNEKKYVIFNKLMKRHNIPILFGDDENYFETFDNWFDIW